MASRLEVVGEREAEEAGPSALAALESINREKAKAAALQDRATQMLFTAIAALSKRALIALAALFTLLTVASAFYLWMTALPEITTLKIIACSIYSAFILALNWRKP